MPAAERPLAGVRVLLTRSPERAARLGARLEALGARVELRPAIALAPPRDPAPAREAVRSLRAFDWIVFTSANGVAFFAEMFRELHGADAGPIPRVGAIGPATADAVRAAGYAPEVVSAESTGEGLARAIGGRLEAGVRVLLVRPEAARPALERMLAAAGALVKAVAFYRNVASAEVEELRTAIREARFDAVLLSSPSTLDRLVEGSGGEAAALLAALRRTRIVAIGPVTADAVVRRGLSVAAVASSPTDDALVDCLCRLFS